MSGLRPLRDLQDSVSVLYIELVNWAWRLNKILRVFCYEDGGCHITLLSSMFCVFRQAKDPTQMHSHPLQAIKVDAFFRKQKVSIFDVHTIVSNHTIAYALYNTVYLKGWIDGSCCDPTSTSWQHNVPHHPFPRLWMTDGVKLSPNTLVSWYLLFGPLYHVHLGF